MLSMHQKQGVMVCCLKQRSATGLPHFYNAEWTEADGVRLEGEDRAQIWD